MSTIPVWVIIRQTLDARSRPVRLYLGKDDTTSVFFSHNIEDAFHFMTKRAASEELWRLFPRHGNESIVEIQTDSVKVV